ncbi:MAG: diacylglycerol kinase family lipid kinase [Eubacteriales bacterium]|nr:diacylglycerol kinase family lipid kinase [Eubacteriales bacterium]
MLSKRIPKLMLIINPTAGKNQARNQMFNLTNYFFRSGYHVTVFPTQQRGDGTQFASEHAAGYDRVVCVGGDGTLNEVVAGLMMLPKEQRPILGYVPAGTTNDFASTLGISPHMEESMKQTMEGEPFFCDIGRFNGHFFTYVAAFGLFTDVSYDTPQSLKNMLGHFAYILEGVKSLATVRSYHLTVDVDGEQIEDTFIYGQISNSTSVGGVMDIGRTGVQLDDGLFEVLLIKMPTNPLELNDTIGALMLQKVEDCPRIYFRRAARVRVLAEEPIAWTLDGEAGGVVADATAEILPHSIALSLMQMPNQKNLIEEVEEAHPDTAEET